MTVIPGLSVKGLAGLEAALTRGAAQADLAARANVQVAAATLIREAQANFEGEHKRHQPHVPNSGGYPNVVTGTLRRSIQSDGLRTLGPALYSTKVGPTTKYGRAIELGNPHSHSGAYPYFGPAVRRVRGKIGSIAALNWSRMIRF